MTDATTVTVTLVMSAGVYALLVGRLDVLRAELALLGRGTIIATVRKE